MTFSLLHERAQDAPCIDFLMDRAFGADRKSRTVYSLREGITPLQRLNFVATDDEGIMLGSIRYWPVKVGNTPAVLLGPIAVDPALQGRGIGKALINHSLFQARRHGDAACILVGDPKYYQPFGFTSAAAAGLILGGPVDLRRFQVLELTPGGLEGVRGLITRDEVHAVKPSQTHLRESF